MKALGLVAVVTFFGTLALLFGEGVALAYSSGRWSLLFRVSLFAAHTALLVTLAFAIGHTVAALALPTGTSRWSVMAVGVTLTLGFFALVITGAVPIGAER